MTLLALTSTQKDFWYVALGLGLVVVLVVIGVLLLLRSLVRDIDVGVANLWTVTKRLAQNTTGMYQFAGTASIARALREEVIRHAKALSQR
jgi:hypothetical protein